MYPLSSGVQSSDILYSRVQYTMQPMSYLYRRAYSLRYSWDCSTPCIPWGILYRRRNSMGYNRKVCTVHCAFLWTIGYLRGRSMVHNGEYITVHSMSYSVLENALNELYWRLMYCPLCALWVIYSGVYTLHTILCGVSQYSVLGRTEDSCTLLCIWVHGSDAIVVLHTVLYLRRPYLFSCAKTF